MSHLPTVEFLSGGARLHLQHGPIDLIIGADGDRFNAFFAAQKRFDTVLAMLVEERPLLRSQLSPESLKPRGPVAANMHSAAMPFCDTFLTPMICVAGAVADEILTAMKQIAPLTRAYVNNGGDISLHLTEGTTFNTAIMGHDNHPLGQLQIAYDDAIGGIATSGRHGRSQSLGIADAVTVLAKNAATADTAATLIANAVDLPDNPAIRRQPASKLNPDSDLGERLVVTGCGDLTDAEVNQALDRGAAVARRMVEEGKIIDAALFLRSSSRVLGRGHITPTNNKRVIEHA